MPDQIRIALQTAATRLTEDPRSVKRTLESLRSALANIAAISDE